MLEAALLVAVAGLAFFVFKIQRKFQWLSGVLVTQADLTRAFSQDRHLERCREYLGVVLQLDPALLPPVGGWGASPDVLLILAEHTLSKKPSLIVEFGSGVSTIVLARCIQLNGSGKLLSFDDDETFAALTVARASRLGLAVEVKATALSTGQYAGEWYAADLPSGIDLLFIDGPPSHIHPETREGAATAFSKLSPGSLIVLDDASRQGERAIAKRWAAAFPHIRFTYLDTDRGVLLGVA